MGSGRGFRTSRWLAAVCAACMVAGCGGDDDDPGGSSPGNDAGTSDTGTTDSGKTDTGTTDTGTGDTGTDADSGTTTETGADVVCPNGYTGSDCSDCADGYQDNDDDGSCLPDCEMTGVECQANQLCDDSSGEVACVCDEGYQDHDGDGSCLADCDTAALACGENQVCNDSSGTAGCVCADGYQDHDGDGVCVADCDTAQLDCNGHGTCDDTSGEARCVCETGYDGRLCNFCDSPYYQDFDEDGTCETTCYFEPLTCAENHDCSDESGTRECVCSVGYQDKDNDGTCLPDCHKAMAADTDPLVCPEHNAHCDDEDGTADCHCDEGYADDVDQDGDDCLACDTGYQDNDDDGTCLPDCAKAATDGLDCGSEGCDDSSGTARCNCPTGQQDNDFDGVCKDDCATAALGCDPADHKVCDDASGTAACVCDTGYYGTGKGDCLLSGGAGDACADMLELTDLSDGVVVSDMTSAAGDFAFSCNGYGFPFVDMVHHIHVAAGESRQLELVTNVFDTEGRVFIPAVALFEGADCATAAEVACGYGVNAGGYIVPAGIDVTLDGGTAGNDYYLVVGLFDYFGTGAMQAQTYMTNICAAGQLYSPATDTCVSNPCLNPNPCTEADKNGCSPDVSVDPATYTCACNAGYVDNGSGACEQNPTAEGEGCADVIPIPVAPGPGTQIAGSTLNALDDGEGTCSVDPAPDRVYGFTLTEEMRVNFTVTPSEEFDCLMHLRRTCDDPGSQVLCADTEPPGGADSFSRVLGPGTYFLFVDGWNGHEDPKHASGDYTLDFSFYTDPCADEETACPGEPVCHAHDDWSGFDCVCEDDGELFHNDSCVADPCADATCSDNTHCVANLADETYDCECDAIYVDDGAGGCMVKPDAKWTVMVYWAMDNNLTRQSLPELQDWVNVNYNEDVRMVVLVDAWNEDSYIVEMLPGEMKTVYEFGTDVDTGDWQTLADFGVWAVNNYPAEHYVLVPSDHGGAWRKQTQFGEPVLKSICHDEHTDNIIGVANGELAAAFTAITNAAGQKLDFVIYDACLMGTWEMAEVTAPYAHYMLASEESQYAFQNYTDWLNFLVDNIDTVTLEELGEVFIQIYAQGGQFDVPGTSYAVTASLTDLATAGDLTTAVNGFADALMANESDTFYASLDGVRRDSQRMEYQFLVDLGDFARNVSMMNGVHSEVAAAAEGVMSQLDTTVVYDWANIHGTYKDLSGATGLSIYLPPAWFDPDWGYGPVYTDSGAIWAQHSSWDEFVHGFGTGTGGSCADGTEAIDYMGATVSEMLPIGVSFDRPTNSPHIAQSFLAPADELHGVRVAVVKTEADAHEHEGFTVGIRNAKGQWVYGPSGYWRIEPNAGDVQYICVNMFGVEVEAGEMLELVLFGGDPHWSYSGDAFATPINWPLTYAADDASDPPYADGDVRFDDGQNGEILIQDYNGDGIRATMWFEIY